MERFLDNVKQISKRYNIMGFIITNKLTLFMSFVFLIGMLVGTICIEKVKIETIRNLDFLFCSDFKVRLNQTWINNFIASFSSSFIFVIFMVIMAFSFPGLIFIPVILMFRGVGLGLVGGYLYLIYGLKGVAFYILILIPGIFISSLGLISISCDSMRFSYKLSSKLMPKSGNDRLWNEMIAYLKRVGYTTVIFVISPLADITFMMLFSRFFKF